MGLNSFFGDKFMKFDNGDIDFLGFFFSWACEDLENFKPCWGLWTLILKKKL